MVTVVCADECLLISLFSLPVLQDCGCDPNIENEHGYETDENPEIIRCHYGCKYSCCTGICRHTPGQGADLSRIFCLPETPQLSQLTGRTDECAQIQGQVYYPLPQC